MLKEFDWTDQKFEWPRVVSGVKTKGNLRRWNPITRKNFLMDAYDGKLEWFMFAKPKPSVKVLPENFDELLDKPDVIDASKLTFKAWAPSRPEMPKTEMVFSTGQDSTDEIRFDEGNLISALPLRHLEKPRLEDANWRAKGKGHIPVQHSYLAYRSHGLLNVYLTKCYERSSLMHQNY